MQKRIQNELNFGKWIETDTRGRIYFFEIKGKLGWKAKYSLRDGLKKAIDWYLANK